MFYCIIEHIVLLYTLWGVHMADYKEMYLKMVRASEEAVNRIVAAQRECEELYLSSPEPELKVLKQKKRMGESGGKKP